MSIAMNQTDIVRWLSTPEAYDERPSQVDRLETHISWVFLTDRFVYKLKKPVQFDFIDFGTLERRRQACQDEVRLNRRMAPDVYRGVLPVCRQPNGTLQLGGALLQGATREGTGEVVDWVVQMERLPAEQMLDELIRKGQLQTAAVERLATFLADFYAAAPALPVAPEAYREHTCQRVRANRKMLWPGPSESIWPGCAA